MFAWTQIASGGEAQVTWAPDSEHFFIQDGGTGQDQIQVFDAAGAIVKTFGATEPMWLDSSTVAAYDDNAYPPADPGADGFDQFYTVPSQSLDVTCRTIEQVELPCCYPMPNGHGAVATTRYLPETVSGVKRPTFEVWQDGQASAERDGEPLGWDAAGDKLAVLHPTQPGRAPSGWLEILSWPGMKSLYSGDSQENGGEAVFDPTGNYVANSLTSKDASGIWRLQIDVVDLATGSVASVPVAGDSTKNGEGYVWNAQSQIVTFTSAEPVVSTYDPDGTKVSDHRVPAKTFYQASADGTTLVGFHVDLNTGKSTDLIAYRDGASAPLNAPGEVLGLFVSPDGRRIVISVGSPGQATAYFADVPV